MGQSGCSMCGACCFNEIPVTLLDVQRLSSVLGLEPGEVFAWALAPGVSPRSGLFSMRKRPSRACIFLEPDRRCRVHPAKPTVCRLYTCRPEPVARSAESSPGPEGQEVEAMWEESVAREITRAYIDKHGTTWDERDFLAAVASLSERIKVRETQTLKVGRDPSGAPLGVVYDCSRCSSPGEQARETPVTLDDIRRMADVLGTSMAACFDRYLDAAPSSQTGGLKLRRRPRCVLLDPALERCTLGQARPRHCLFTPCPRQVLDGSAFDALYLGSGSVREQFRHQAALALTREYVAAKEVAYSQEAVRRSLERLDRITDDPSEQERFAARLAPFRYRNGFGAG